MAVPPFQLLRTKSMILCLALWEAKNVHDSAFFSTSQIYFITSKTWALTGTFAALPPPIVSHQDDWDSLLRVSMLVISTEQPMILFKHKSGLSILLLKNPQWLPISEAESSQCLQDSAHQPPYPLTSSPTSSLASSVPVQCLSCCSPERQDPAWRFCACSFCWDTPSLHLVSFLQVSVQMPPYQEGLLWTPYML